MTTARIIGTAFGDGILQAKNKFRENRDGSMQILRTFRALGADWITRCPQRGSAHPDMANAVLMERSADQSSIPFLVDVTLTYETPRQDGSPGGALPPDEYSETANSVEAPIEAHPGFSKTYTFNGTTYQPFGTVDNGAIFNSDGKFTGWTKDSPFAGYLTYKVPSVTETVTKYYWAKPPSVTQLINRIDPGDAHWLIITGSTQRRYPYWAQSVSRIWNAVFWPAAIYPN